MQVLGFMAGALHGGAVGGGLGSVVTGVGTVAGAAAAGLVEGTAAAVAVGELVDATYYLRSDNDGPKSGNAGFANKRTLQETKIGGKNVSVDAERGGSGQWNVHVKVNGEKVYIEKPGDLGNLPGSVRKNADVQKAVQDAFDYIQKAQP